MSYADMVGMGVSNFAEKKRLRVLLSVTLLCAYMCLLLCSLPLTAQEAVTESEPEETVVLPESWQGISLGMSVEEVKEALLSNSLFGYRGERDVSLLPGEERTLIETAGLSFVSRSWFQFYQDKLHTMIFSMNPSLIDYFSLSSSLEEKYGVPSSFSPEKMVWEDGIVTLSLERPLTLKYIDTAVFNSLLEQSRVGQSVKEMLQEDFLGSF
jgi:hypothetical protein